MPDISFRIADSYDGAGAAKAKSDLEGLGHAAESSGGMLGKLKDGLIGLAVGGASIGALKEGISSCVDAASSLGDTVEKMQRQFGGTAEDASHLREMFQLGGADPDKAVTALDRLSKGLVSTTGKPTAVQKEMDALGVSYKDAAGQMLPMAQLLPQLADKFQAMPDGPQKTALAMQLFGKSGTDMIEVLNHGSAGLAAMTKEGDKLGLTMSGKNLDAIHQNVIAHREFGAAMQGLQVTIGNLLMPVLTAGMGLFAKIAMVVVSTLIPAIKGIADLFEKNWLPVIKEFVGSLLPMFMKWFTDIGNWFKTVVYPIFLQLSDLLYQKLLVYFKDLRDNILPQLLKLFTDVGNWLKNTLIPAFTELATAIADKLKVPLQDVLNFLQQHQEIFGAIAIAIGLVAAGMAAFAIATGIATGAATAFAAVMAVVTSPVLLIVGAIALLVLGIVELNKHWDDIVAAVPALGVAFNDVKVALAAVSAWLTTVFLPDAQAAFSGVVTAATAVVGWVRDHWHEIQDLITPILDFVKQYVVTTFDTIKGVIQIAFDLITGIIKVAMDLIHGNWSQAWDDIKTMFSNVFNDIKGIVTAQLDLLKALFKDTWDEVSRAFSDVWPTLKKLVSAGLNDIVDWIKANWVAIVGTVLLGPIFLFRDQIADVLTAAAGKVLDGLGTIKDDIASWAKDAGTWLLSAGGDVISGFIKGLESKFDDVKNSLGGLTKLIPSWKGPDDETLLTPSGQTIIKGLQAGMESQYGAVEASLTGFGTQLTNQVTALAGTVSSQLANITKGVAGIGQSVGAGVTGGGGGQTLSAGQIAQLLLGAGATTDEASILTQIALRESSGVTNIPNAQGSGALGLFQFMPGTAAGVGLANPAGDPAAQAAAALRLFRQNGGSDWLASGPIPSPKPLPSAPTQTGAPWNANGQSGYGTPPAAPPGWHWETDTDGVQRLYSDAPPTAAGLGTTDSGFQWPLQPAGGMGWSFGQMAPAVTAQQSAFSQGTLLEPTVAGQALHEDTDLITPDQTPVTAGASGVVSSVVAGVGGTAVFIRFPNDVQEVIGHLSDAVVKVGDQIAQGQIVGHSGGQVAGHSVGEIAVELLLPNGTTVDPESMLGQMMTTPAGQLTLGRTAPTAFGNQAVTPQQTPQPGTGGGWFVQGGQLQYQAPPAGGEQFAQFRQIAANTTTIASNTAPIPDTTTGLPALSTGITDGTDGLPAIAQSTATTVHHLGDALSQLTGQTQSGDQTAQNTASIQQLSERIAQSAGQIGASTDDVVRGVGDVRVTGQNLLAVVGPFTGTAATRAEQMTQINQQAGLTNNLNQFATGTQQTWAQAMAAFNAQQAAQSAAYHTLTGVVRDSGSGLPAIAANTANTVAAVRAGGGTVPLGPPIAAIGGALGGVPWLPGLTGTSSGMGTGAGPTGGAGGKVSNPFVGIGSYQHGGYVPATGLAYLHAGETVLPAGSGNTPILNVYISTLDVAGMQAAIPTLARQLQLHYQRSGMQGVS